MSQGPAFSGLFMLQPSKQHRQMDQRLGMNSPECISNSTSLATPQYHNTPSFSELSPGLLSSTLPPFSEGSKVSSALISDVFPSLAHPAESAAIAFCSAPPWVAAVLVEMRRNMGRERRYEGIKELPSTLSSPASAGASSCE